MGKHRIIGLNLVIGLLLASCAQNTDTEPTFEPMPDIKLPTTISDRLTLEFQRNPERGVQRFERMFKQHSQNDRIPVAKLQDLANQRAAEVRANILLNYLRLDKDGSGDLSKQEMEEFGLTQSYDWMGDKSNYLALENLDLNADGRISLHEMYVDARKQEGFASKLQNDILFTLNAFNSNDDEFIDRDELNKGMAKLRAEAENPSLRSAPIINRNAKPKETEAPGECKPAPPALRDKLVFISGYEGDTYSPVSVVGLDEETEVVTVTIAPGKDRFFIMANAYTPLIWQFEGDTDRVSKFVTPPNRKAKGTQAGTGIVGLSENQVEFIGKGCLNYFHDYKSDKAKLAKVKWAELIDRKPDEFIASYKLSNLQLPTKTLDKNERPVVKQVESPGIFPEVDMRFYKAGGIANFSADDVIAPGKIEPYDVMPTTAGLIQLIKSGHLEPVKDNTFKIVKPMPRFPAGLAGAVSVRFILGSGVPLPGGDPGHSRVVSEDTGECISGPRC